MINGYGFKVHIRYVTVDNLKIIPMTISKSPHRFKNTHKRFRVDDFLMNVYQTMYPTDQLSTQWALSPRLVFAL
jgi:hypothetical protein